MKIFLRTVFIMNILVVALALLGYAGSYLDPRKFGIAQSTGLILPWTLLFLVVFASFWLVLKDKRAWVSIICLLLGFGHIGRFVGFSFRQAPEEGNVSLLTYNSQSYNKSNQISQFLTDGNLPSTLKIICLQEVSDEHIEEIRNQINMSNAFFHKGKMILTQYPVKAQGKIQFDESVNGCIWADLEVGQQIVRVFNVHFRSNRIPGQKESVLTQVASSQGRENIAEMLVSYRLASKERVSQAERIAKEIRNCPHPVLLAGDFNDTPFSYTYQIIANELTDQFRSKGLGLGSTYAGALPGLKIDYIFADENFEGVSHRILRTQFSDHFPVISHLILD